jgi:drug/metabolite transporter (DMT)-like permease
MQIRDVHARNTSFSRALIAGLICGLVAAVLNAVYNFYYRKATGFERDKLIEPMMIFMAMPLLFIITSFIFFEMVEFLKRGKLIFTLLSILLLIVAVIVGLSEAISGINGLLFGMAIITGLLIAFLLPFLATHPKIFMEDEELSESGES